MNIINMADLNLYNKRVLIRSDFNVPIKNGKIVSDKRIIASIPTIEMAINKGASVMIFSHLGRPIEGKYNKHFSLQPIADYLNKKLSLPVFLIKDYLNKHDNLFSKEGLIILENVRFNKGEKKNDDILAKKYADMCDIFVMNAFGSSHLSHASTHGVAKFAPIACAGPLLLNELNALNKVLSNPSRPMIAIVGGSKTSTKMTLLDSLSKISDRLIVGGAIANTFIAAQGYNVGKSIYEADMICEAKKLTEISNIPVPYDVYVSNEFSETAPALLKYTNNIQDNEQILDIGKESVQYMVEIIKKAKTILWNGPVGVFEFSNFRRGTETIAHTIANSESFSVIGGGDTISAIELFGFTNQISYISTGGGAFLELIEGKKLPSISILEERANFLINNINSSYYYE